MKYLITIIGNARTGTNYICNLLDNTFSQINSNYELFNIKKCFLNPKYQNKIISEYNNQNISNIARHNPISFLKKIKDVSEEPIISHKIFDEHLSFKNVTDIIDVSHCIFIVKRNYG